MKMFDPNGPLMIALGKLADIVICNIMFCLFSLPVFTVAAVPGLAIGCVLANLLTGCAVWDVVFGSVATLIGAIGTRLLKNKPLLAWIPPVLSNMAIIPIILIKVYAVPDAWWFLVLTVGAGEVLSCGVLGLLLWRSLKNIPAVKEMK